MITRGTSVLISSLFIVYIFCISACHTDVIFDGPEIGLRFSLDTLRFDTVFTQAGSATRFVKIFNEEDEAVVINEIKLENASGFFRLNIDGIPGSNGQNIRIEARDSVYLFAEVTIDPDLPLSISPFIVENRILISANNSSYDIHLEAWGQNANYFPSRDSKGLVNFISCDFNEWVWDDPRPYVIYGALLIDSCELVIPAGQNVYVHGGIAINELGIYNDGILIFLTDGSLKTNGTADEPVIFQTDRLEPEFFDVAGQWSGILFTPGSRDNILKHTKIRNSIVGLSVDSSSFLRLEECEIAYTSGNGISASHAAIYAQNTLFYNNFGNAISLNYGGGYVFNYCTIVNTDNQQTAVTANNLRCSDPLCSGPIFINALYTEFNNCIIVGNDDDEISLLDANNGTDPTRFVYSFNNSIVSVDELLDADAFPNFFDNCVDCINLQSIDSLFIDIDSYDLHLDTMSIAIDKGVKIDPIFTDLEGNPRDIDTPDLGCYEFQK